MALVAWSSEKIKTILGDFLFLESIWALQNKFITQKNNMKAFIFKINGLKKLINSKVWFRTYQFC
jgi:hypothetical protein